MVLSAEFASPRWCLQQRCFGGKNGVCWRPGIRSRLSLWGCNGFPSEMWDPLVDLYIYVSSIEGITDGGRVVDASEMQEVSIFSIILKFLFYNGRFLLHKLEGWQLVNFAAGCFKQPWLFTKEVWRWMFVTTDFLTWILPSHLVSQSASEHKCHWRCVVWMSWGVIRLLSCSSSSRFAWYDLAHWGLGSYGPRTSRDKTWFQSSMAQA